MKEQGIAKAPGIHRTSVYRVLERLERFDTEFARNLPSREEVSPDRMTACRGAG